MEYNNDHPSSNWIKGGLKCVEKSGQRYFFEQDIINYLWKRYKGDVVV